MSELKDYVFRFHKLPSLREIYERLDISESKGKEICDILERQRQVYTIAGGGKGKPRIIIPYNMMQYILTTQPKPEWLKEERYSFKEISELQSKIEEIRMELKKFEEFQRLLYSTNVALEKAVAYALKYIGFNDVKHHLENRDYADITFEENGIKYLVEVEGTTKQGSKDKILQLDGWLRIDIEKGFPANKLRGIYVINHERDLPPDERGEPLTEHAKQYMIRYNFILVTTRYLFDIIKKVHYGQLTKDEAKKLILRGERIGF